MKVLVLDDNKINCEAARAQLLDHELTVVSTYREAEEALVPRVDFDKYWSILKGRFGSTVCDFLRSGTREAQEAKKEVRRDATVYLPNFEVVLSDLFVPASSRSCGEKFAGQIMPVGVFIGLLGAVRASAKYVAVFTDTDHHSHPASACFDCFNENEHEPTPFIIGESRVLLTNNRHWVEEFDPTDLSKPLCQDDKRPRSERIRTKNWRGLLDYLVK